MVEIDELQRSVNGLEGLLGSGKIPHPDPPDETPRGQLIRQLIGWSETVDLAGRARLAGQAPGSIPLLGDAREKLEASDLSHGEKQQFFTLLDAAQRVAIAVERPAV